MNQNPHNILIIKPGAMGDLLHITPTIRGLHKRFPLARIDIMVGNRASVDLFRHNPYITDVLVYNRHSEHRSFSSLLALWKQVRSRSYDLVINFQRSNLKTWFLTSAAFPCHVLIYNKSRSKIIHAVQDHLKTVTPLGILPDSDDLELYITEEQINYATTLFNSHNLDKLPVIAINPGASHPVNRWSSANFAKLADKISAELNAFVIVIGGSGDTTLAHEIEQLSNSHPLILTGKTDILQLGAVLKRAALLISADTGPMHLATAVGTPVIALFGAADPKRTGPVGAKHCVIQAKNLSCVPCRSRECHNSNKLECMKLITVDEVFYAVKEMLDQRKSCASLL